MTVVLPDTSVWIREHQPRVRRSLADAVEEDRALMATPIALELLRSARDSFDARVTNGRLALLRWVPLTATMERRSREVLLLLTHRGYHRGPSPVDLLTAAAAEAADAELWHCDRHFELIGEITGQPMRRL